MSALSRRAAFTTLLAAVSGAALALAGVAHADQSGAEDDPKKPHGGNIKGALTPEDRAINSKCIAKTMKEAPTGAVWKWNNPKSGNHGTVTPTSGAKRHAGKLCRDFEETITLKDGRSEKIKGRACQAKDGSWSIVA